MFELNNEETRFLRSQIVTSNLGAGGSRYLPNVFTEQGVAMLSSVLSSPRAIQMNILIIRAFVHMREFIVEHKDISIRVERIENTQKKHSSIITILADEIEKLTKAPEVTPKRKIGFRVD